MRYDLHIEGKVISSGDIDDLRRQAKRMGLCYEIYMVFESKFPGNKPTKFVEEKMTEREIENAYASRKRGNRLSVIAKKYNVDTAWLNKKLFAYAH